MAFRKHSLIVLFSLLILSARAQSSEQNGYVKDFTILTASLKELYPMLYKMRDSASLENSIRDISGGLLHARSRNEALYLFQSFMYEFGDVHAGVESIYAGLEVEKILPFKIILIGDSLFIKDFPSQPAFIGSRIESINGHKTENIIDSLNVLYGTDGNHVPGLVLQPLFNSFYAAFIEQSDSFRVATNKGIFWTHCIKKGDTEFEKMTSNSWKNYMVTDHDWVKMEINTDYAYFRFLSFDKKVNGINIETEFNKMLDELAKRNIPNLVIDLRYNSGGDPYMAGRMASRLVEEPFAVFERLIVLQPSTITYPKNLEIDRSYAGDGVIKVGDHFEKMKGDKGLKPVMPAKNIFKGKIYVLTGPMTESTSTSELQSHSFISYA